MPEKTKAALIRLHKALQEDGLHAIRTDYHNGTLSAFVRGNLRDSIRYVVLVDNDFYEQREGGE
jgi:hypothetical protein